MEQQIILINQFNNNKMKVNDSTDQSFHLLKWVNNERFIQGQTYPFITLQQISYSNTLEQILHDIDSKHFQDFNLQEQEHLEKIQTFLDKEHGKRMRLAYKHTLSHINQLIKLTCYFCTKCSNRNTYINRIFNLPPLTQQFLMEELQRIQGQLENIVEIKEILGRVECIEEENEGLREKLTDLSDTHLKLITLYEELQQEHQLTKVNLDKLQKEKEEVFAALGINNMKEYIEVFKETKEENKELILLIQRTQEKQRITEENLHVLNKRILGDTIVINELNDQLTKYKDLYLSLKEQNHLNNLYSGNVLLEAKKKNQMFRSGISHGKENMKGSFMKSIETNNNSYSLLSEEDDDYEKLRKYNNELMVKLEDMYTKYNKLSDDFGHIRHRNEELEKENLAKERKCKNVRHAQAQFMKKYMRTVSMGK